MSPGSTSRLLNPVSASDLSLSLNTRSVEIFSFSIDCHIVCDNLVQELIEVRSAPSTGETFRARLHSI
jgi:hypothetical protein